jgi:hypothetical protein
MIKDNQFLFNKNKSKNENKMSFIKFIFSYLIKLENFVEILYILRPLIYLSLMIIFGKKSLIPLIINIVMDIIILKIKRKEKKFMEQKVYTFENAYRFGQLGVYLLREPIFSLITLPFLRKILRILRLSNIFDNMLVRLLSYYTYLHFTL